MMNLLLVILPFLGGFGPCDYPFFGAGYGFWADPPAIFEELQLSPEQKQIVQNLELEHRGKMIDLRANLEKEALKLKEILVKENLEENEVYYALENLSKAQNALMKEKLNFFFNLKKVLPKEKWNLLKNLIFEKWPRRGPKGERPRGPRR